MVSRPDTGPARRIDPGERLGYEQHGEFRACYQPLLGDPSVREIVIDFHRTTYLDSAALGMLLMLRTAAEKQGKKVVLAGATGRVRDVLDIAHAHDLFELR